jgi:tetratricopeptide (TPR) repeat protein
MTRAFIVQQLINKMTRKLGTLFLSILFLSTYGQNNKCFKKADRLINKRNYSEALSLINQYLLKDSLSLQAHSLRADCHYRLGEYESGIKDINYCIARDSNKAEYYSIRGYLYHRSDSDVQALADFNKALIKKSDYSKAYTGKGAVYYTKRDYNEALSNYLTAIKINKKDYSNYYGLGVVYLMKSDYQKAIYEFSKSLDLKHNEPIVLFAEGYAYQELGEYEKAINDYKKVLKYYDRLQPWEKRYTKSVFEEEFLINLMQSQTDYIDHPNDKDSACKCDVRRAKKEFKSGKLVFCETGEWNTPYSRMFPELDSLCKHYGLTFYPDSGVERDYWIIGDPNTYYCYKQYMDREIKKRFGASFREKLLNDADSLFKIKSINDTLPYAYCDVKPNYCKESKQYYSYEKVENDFFQYFVFPNDTILNAGGIHIKFYLNVFFIIDTSGHASGYIVSLLIHNINGNAIENIFSDIDTISENKYIKEYRKVIQTNIINALEKMNCWSPGMIGYRKVKSSMDLDIDFIKHRIY